MKTIWKKITAVCLAVSLALPVGGLYAPTRAEAGEILADVDPVKDVTVYADTAGSVQETAVGAEAEAPVQEAGEIPAGADPVQDAAVRAEAAEPAQETALRAEEEPSAQGAETPVGRIAAENPVQTIAVPSDLTVTMEDGRVFSEGEQLGLIYKEQTNLGISGGILNVTAEQLPDSPQDASVVDVRETGSGITVTAVGIGTAFITVVTSEGISRTIGVVVDKDDHSLTVPDGLTVRYTPQPFVVEGISSDTAKAEGVSLLYETDDENVAVVDESGGITLAGLRSSLTGKVKTTVTVTVPESAHYNEVSEKFVLTVKSNLKKPVMDAATDQGDGFLVTWKPVDGAEGYRLCRMVSGGAWELLSELAGGENLSFKDTNIETGKNYDYRVQAVAFSGADASAVSDSVSTRRLTAPVLTVSQTASGNRLSWTGSDGVDGYSIFRRENAAQDWTLVREVSGSSTCSWVDTFAANGAVSYYMVQASYRGAPGPASNEAGIFYLASPAVKKYVRKSPVKMRVKWTANPAASGYQVQYAKNSLFSGAATVTVPGSTAVSMPITNLEKNRTYFVRVRAYRTDGSGTRYSAWALGPGTGGVRQASAVPVTRKGKTFEVRSAARLAMNRYDTIQGACSDGKFAYVCMYNRRTDKCRIVKVKLSNRKVVGVSPVLNVDHGNDITYNNATGKLIVLHASPNFKRLTIVNKNTLQAERTVDTAIPAQLPGASPAQLRAVSGFTAIAYSAGRNQYAAKVRGKTDVMILDADLNPVRYLTLANQSGYTHQAMDATDDYLLLAQSHGSSRSSGNRILVYTWEGDRVSEIRVRSGYEMESIFHAKDQYYAGFYRSYNQKYYTREKRTVLVKGKKKKVTVKVPHTRLMRDNYLYHLTTL